MEVTRSSEGGLTSAQDSGPDTAKQAGAAASGGLASATGGLELATGGLELATGGLASATGGLESATGGLASATGGPAGPTDALAAADTREPAPKLQLGPLLEAAAAAHGHLCAGQVLGVRMAIHACALLGVTDPRGAERKRLVTFVEIDRCATDAIGVVTGCRLGKRALKFEDWGKMAATFVDLTRALGGDVYGGVRVAARESSKELARARFPEIPNKNEQQMLAYRELSDDDLFAVAWVEVPLPPNEFPGFKGPRVTCERCGEGISYKREVLRDGTVLCRGCAAPQQRYYRVVPE